MPKSLAGKRILLISPQPWDHIAISKHHYAQVLGRDNEVVFLQPPDPSLPRGDIRIRRSGTPGVNVADWRPLTPRRLRFHAYPLYKALIRFDAKRITDALGGSLDILWCFDFNLFPDLRAFGARFTIFHPVDPISLSTQAEIGRSADLILSVSEKILRAFASNGIDTRRVVINHGIGPEFAHLSHAMPPSALVGGAVHCGYFGNLDRPVINVPLLAAIAAQNPAVTFHFWGPTQSAGPMYTALSKHSNCQFHGTLGKRELAEAVSRMDCFVIAYIDDPAESDRSNSHKLLEYFAAGRVIVSTRMECYDDPDLLIMSRQPDDADFPALFASVVSEIAAHNSPAKCARRKAVAARYTYESNVAEIDALIGQVNLAPHR